MVQFRPNGQFAKGHTPHNKGVPMKEWMDGRKMKRVLRIGLKNLRHDISPNAGKNRKAVVSVDTEGNWKVYSSAQKASETTGLMRTNIGKCCRKQGRERCGGLRWFFFDDDEWTTLINRDI